MGSGTPSHVAMVVGSAPLVGGAMVEGGGGVVQTGAGWAVHVHVYPGGSGDDGGGGGGGVGRWKTTAPVASVTAKEPPAALEATSEQGLAPAPYVPVL